MTTVAKAFVDTNVLLRAMIPRMTLHQEAEAMIQRMWTEHVELWVSRQVIREYLVQVTHPNTFSPPLEIGQILAQIEVIGALFRVADETQSVTNELLTLLETHPTRGKQIHDANIVATMLTYGINTLLTMNVDDVKRFDDMIQIVALRDGAR